MPVPVANATVTLVIVSVPLEVWSVKLSSIVAAAPGTIVMLLGLVPSARVVVTVPAAGFSATRKPLLTAETVPVAVRAPVELVSAFGPLAMANELVPPRQSLSSVKVGLTPL